MITKFQLENFPRGMGEGGEGGHNWKNLDFKGSMVVKAETKFHKFHLYG